MISIINSNRLLSEHEIYELTHAFYNSEKINISDNKHPNNPRVRLELSNNDSSCKGILLDNKENITSKEVKFRELNIYRDVLSSKKIMVKHIIYKLFEIESGISLPWGILTGIRPTKIVHRLFDLNISIDEIRNILIEVYLLKSDKAELLIKVAKTQKTTLKNIPNNSYSIYINIPFCPSRCSYCSFPYLSAKEYSSYMEGYINAVLKELELSRQKLVDWKINSVYIGGGTPTSLSLSLMERLIYEIKNKFSRINEFSIEAGRPDTLDYTYLSLFKKYKIDRISINPQTMNDKTLQRINRFHTVEDTINCFKQAKEIGIKSINMDIILGLPGEKIYHLKNTVNIIKKLRPDNFTVHVLAIKNGSEYINKKYNSEHGDYNEIDQMMYFSRIAAKDMEMEPYYLYRQKNILGNFENIGYSTKDNICNYNISIMEEKETIIGIGMGAVSKIYNKELDKVVRLPNYKNLSDYTSKFDVQISKKNNELDKIVNGVRDTL